MAVPIAASDEYASKISSYLIEFKGVISLVNGGESRMTSIANAFAHLMTLPHPPEFIAIHDAARPLATAELLERCVDAARETGAAIVAHRVTDTIHISDDVDFIQTTPYRPTLWAAETPQVFRTELYARALRETDWHTNPPTDDASLVRRLPGVKVKLVENTSPNPKITYRHDLVSYENL